MRFIQAVLPALLAMTINALPTVDEHQAPVNITDITTEQTAVDVAAPQLDVDAMLRCLEDIRPQRDSKRSHPCGFALTYQNLDHWPHVNCADYRWDLDSHSWRNSQECYSRCRGYVEAKIRENVEEYRCVESAGFAECLFSYRRA